MSKNYSFIVLLFLFSTITAQNFNYEEQDTFFTELQQQLKDDFKECTGDTVVPELKYLLEWKNRIHLQTQTEEYKEILKEYMVVTGIMDSIVPCHVLSWHKSRIKFLQEQELKAEKKALEKSDRIVDSISFLNEQIKNPTSKFDFEGIPFGFSKKFFLKLYNEKFGSSPVDYDTVFITEHFLYKETPFILRFYFNRDDKFYKYEIESYSYTGNNLNDKIRPAADLIKSKLTENAGKADQVNRIGYFDIKEDKPTLYALWNSDSIKADLYFNIADNRYHTILIVTKDLNIRK